MASLTASRLSIFFPTRPPRPSLLLSLPSFAARRAQELPPPLRLSLGFPYQGGKKGRSRGRGDWVAKGEDDAFGVGGTVDLEAEIYDFMVKSANPRDFPNKDELIAAGRSDLVEAIATQGGWLAFGWDLEEEEDGGNSGSLQDSSQEEDSRVSQQRLPAINGSWKADDSGGVEDSEACSVASSSGRSSMEMDAGNEAGIEGILSRLEKERSLSLALGSTRENEVNCRTLWRSGEHDPGDEVLLAWKKTVGDMENRSRLLSSGFDEDLLHESGAAHPQKGESADANDTSSKPEMWRLWSRQRAGNPVTEFEAAEIVPNEDRKQLDLRDVSVDEKMSGVACSDSSDSNGLKDPYCDASGVCQDQIRLRLQHLESELASALHQLRSKTNSIISQKGGQESSVKELHRLSDALEFKQTEVMKTQDKLRSTRAKLAVLEGKMALEIIEAQKIIDEKKKRIDTAQKALNVLRSACIVWPNPASEVLLTGSFDGWTSQRRMERSNAGIFSLHLKLYPGRYEIKFIVDGVWTIDPLRPIVHNNGHQNNLLIIS